MSIEEKLHAFTQTIYQYYKGNKRSFLWRDIEDPYKVYVSEIMLQQTQTQRVVDKFNLFIQRFPSFQALAQASLNDVLFEWQGLGYNRRGKFLHQAAQIIVNEYDGVLPSDPSLLVQLPGIGPATAASIAAFAFNIPTAFIETNIRAVFIHFFFVSRTDVHDKEIMPLVQRTVDLQNPRQWYYALMDYGVMLKKNMTNPSRKSKHHVRQSRFEGSDRQIRGLIVRVLAATKNHIEYELVREEVRLYPAVMASNERVDRIINELLIEQMISQDEQGCLYIA